MDKSRPVDVVRLSRFDTLWYLPEALARIRSFLEKYDSVADPSTMMATIVSDMWMAQVPRHLILVGLDQDTDQVVAHMLMSCENYYGPKNRINITQLEHDPGYSFQSQYEQGMALAYEWARKMDADVVCCWARNEAVAKVFEQNVGFKRSEKVLMEIAVPPREKE